MKKKVTRMLMAFMIASLGYNGQADTTSTDELLAFAQLPTVPDTFGLGGPLAGASNGALIVGGGSNWPTGMPWEPGAAKAWPDELYVLPKGAGEWLSGFSLPGPRGYSVCITTPDAVVIVGGADAERHYTDTFSLR